MTWTAESVNKMAGREPFSWFAWREKAWARQYGCEPRQTGRTEYALSGAVAAALNGKRVLVVAHSTRYAGELLDRGDKLVRRCLHVPQRTCADTLVIPGAGSLVFRCRGEGHGEWWDTVIYDHFTGETGAARGCRHRVRQGGKMCWLCGERLRGFDLEQARRRRALVRDDPEIARKMGVL